MAVGGRYRLELHLQDESPRLVSHHDGRAVDDLNPSYIGNYELQSSFWKKGEPDEWRTVSVPFSAFRKNIRGVPYDKLPPGSPRAGDVVHLLWFNTGDVDRGLMIDRIWVDRNSQPSEEEP